jgi:nucleoside-diphosphate-sugar epimerase
MSEKVFVAGAAGAVGAALVPLLIEAGYAVYGSTRDARRADALRAQGVQPVVVDVFDAAALKAALTHIAPWAVIHQLTDLPKDLDPARMAEAGVRNARVRTEGTRNLVAAAQAAGVRRLVAQSIAWAYAPGPRPFTEAQPLDVHAEGARRVSVDGVVALEQSVLGAHGVQGVQGVQGITATVLRYGQLYGPGTSTDMAKGPMPLHVADAARAALLALQRSSGGVFNIAEDSAEVSSDKAKRELGWAAR